MKDPEFDPATAVYPPDLASVYAVNAIRSVKEQQTRGLKLPINEIDGYFAPVLPGQICAVIAQTSNYKSAFLHFWERELAEALKKAGRKDEAIIHVSVEECVEEQVFLDMAHETEMDAGKLAIGNVQDWSKLDSAAIKLGMVPIYRIGDSLARAEDMPNLYMSNMVRSIKALADGKVPGRPAIKPAALFFDYLQAFPLDPEIRKSGSTEQRRLQVRDDIYRLRQAAAYFNCPVVVAVQAKQHLDGAKGDYMMPGIYDGEESSSIAQRCDRILCLWMPARSHRVGQSIQVGDKWIKIEENMLYIRVAKQRGGHPAGKSFECRINFLKNVISGPVQS